MIKKKEKVNQNDLINEIRDFAKYNKILTNRAFIENKLSKDENSKK
jgi:hypothetical protein